MFFFSYINSNKSYEVDHFINLVISFLYGRVLLVVLVCLVLMVWLGPLVQC